MKIDAKIADFLGNFVEQDGNRSGQTQGGREMKTTSNGQTVKKIMDKVANQA